MLDEVRGRLELYMLQIKKKHPGKDIIDLSSELMKFLNQVGDMECLNLYARELRTLCRAGKNDIAERHCNDLVKRTTQLIAKKDQMKFNNEK